MKLVCHSSHPAGSLSAYWESRRVVQMASLAGWAVEWIARPVAEPPYPTWNEQVKDGCLHITAPPAWLPEQLWAAMLESGAEIKRPYAMPRIRGMNASANLIFSSEKPTHHWWWRPARPWELPEEALGALLRQKGWTLATAESCTGGFLAHRITAVPGSSDYFQGTVVSYANAVKERLLNVPSEVLRREGAVSEATARAMVGGVVERLHTHAGLATTGIAGPGGGTPQKPVGTVWIGIHTPDVGTQAHCFAGEGSRHDIIEQAATAALFRLLQHLTQTMP